MCMKAYSRETRLKITKILEEHVKNVRTNRSRGYKIHGRKSLVVYHKLLANGNSEHRLVGEKKRPKNCY